MRTHAPLVIIGVGLLALCLLVACTPASTRSPSAQPSPAVPLVSTAAPASGFFVTGIVLDPEGAPVPEATVRIQATTNEAQTDAQGRFVLVGLDSGTPVTVSAWKEGYYCAKSELVTPPTGGIVFRMRLVQTNDNPSYQWLPPTGENSCYSCKAGVTQTWLDHDAHSKSATNFRFLTMYNGTDVNGNQSPLTRYGYSRDYGRIPLLPDPTQPYFGPGYKLDFPETAGNCAACHTPGAAIDAPYGTDPNAVEGANKSGIHCDYCHKVADILLNKDSGLPYANMPGVLSQDIRRPFPQDPDRYQVFFGTFDDDNVPMEDTYLPLLKESQWCAPCHYGIFWGTVVYNSFGEWLASPYSDPQDGRTCQQCHMPAPTLLDGQPITNVAPGKGGVERDPLTIPAHTFPGASSTDLLRNAVTMTAVARPEGRSIVVEVEIVNDNTGHHVPTDSPLRQVILLVQACDEQGRDLSLEQGPTLPDWAGIGDPAEGNYAGLPGKAYAKVLQELWTEVFPSGAYWNPTRILSDTRLAAYARDASRFVFTAPAGDTQVEVRLLFRRAFKLLMDQKGWNMPDIEMARQIIEVPGD
jgi:hypothetical protein